MPPSPSVFVTSPVGPLAQHGTRSFMCNNRERWEVASRQHFNLQHRHLPMSVASAVANIPDNSTFASSRVVDVTKVLLTVHQATWREDFCSIWLVALPDWCSSSAFQSSPIHLMYATSPASSNPAIRMATCRTVAVAASSEAIDPKVGEPAALARDDHPESCTSSARISVSGCLEAVPRYRLTLLCRLHQKRSFSYCSLEEHCS